jgi:hypothetical protein
MTEYEEYTQYQDGDVWEYNTEMSRLFEDRVAKGNISARPTASEAPENAIWIATDENLIYRNDGVDGWVVEGHGSSGSPVPEGDYVSLLTETLEANSPTNLDNLSFPDLDSGPSSFREGIIVQMGDDSASAGDVGYTAPVHFVTESGERIATMAADKVHNHVGFYTRGSAFDGSDAQPVKRLNIQGGTAEVDFDFYTVDNMELKGTAPELHLFSEAGNDTKFTQYEDNSVVHQIQWDAGRNDVRFQHFNAASAPPDYMEIAGDEEQIEFNWDMTDDATNVIYDQSAAHIPRERVEGGSPISYSPGHTEWADGLSNEEVCRWTAESGVTYVFENIGFSQNGGGTSADASLDLYNVSAGTQMATVDLGTSDTINVSTSSGQTVIARITNSTGSLIEASPHINGYKN